MTEKCSQRLLLLTAFALACKLAIAASPPTQLWVEQIGTTVDDYADALATDAAGNCYLAGYSAGSLGGSNAGGTDIVVGKYDSTGQRVWLIQFGTPQADTATSIVIDAAGNSYITGTTSGKLGSVQFGGVDGFVAKIDPLGAIVWIEQFGSAASESPAELVCDASGSVFVTGTIIGNPSGTQDVFASKIDQDGHWVWTRQWGSTAADTGKSIDLDQQGNLYVTGETAGTLPGQVNLGATDLFVTKLDAGGGVVWHRQFGTSTLEVAMRITVDRQTGVYVGGSTLGNLGGSQIGQGDAFLSKFSTDGDLLWSRQFGTTGWDGIHNMTLSHDGVSRMIVGGCGNSPQCYAFLREFDAAGNELWHRTTTSTQYVCGGPPGLDSEGNIYQLGVTSGPAFGTYSGTGNDIFLLKLASNETPVITTAPSGQTVTAGRSVTLTVTATSEYALSYQWQLNGTAIAGATSAALTLSNFSAAQAGDYTVVVTNVAGSKISSVAKLTISALPPTVTTHPVSQTVVPGGSATLGVTATGDAPLTYQWRKDGTAISGATGAVLTFSSLTAAQAGDYTVVVSNSAGSTTSRLARLTVATPDEGRLSNLSVRATAGVGSQPLIVGLVVSGGTKRLLLRAVGPGLTSVFGLAGTLANPRIDVHQTVGTEDRIVASNDNWAATVADQAALSAVFASVGAFALPATSLDASLTLDVDGSRTVHANGVPAGSSGIVLVEGYDTGTGNTARLVNLSARNPVGAGGDILIAGFVIGGNVPKRLLIRGIGPALTTLFGVTGALADPMLELHATISGQDTVVASNDNWGDEPGAAAAMTSVGAYGLPTGSRDAALLVTLPAGAYTAQVSGVGSLTGDAVVEVYEVP